MTLILYVYNSILISCIMHWEFWIYSDKKRVIVLIMKKDEIAK